MFPIYTLVPTCIFIKSTITKLALHQSWNSTPGMGLIEQNVGSKEIIAFSQSLWPFDIAKLYPGEYGWPNLLGPYLELQLEFVPLKFIGSSYRFMNSIIVCKLGKLSKLCQACKLCQAYKVRQAEWPIGGIFNYASFCASKT